MMKKSRRVGLSNVALLLALGLSIPAFYLMLAGPPARYAGSVAYGGMALLLAARLYASGLMPEPARVAAARTRAALIERRLEWLLLLGAVASAWPSALPWSGLEWGARLALCALAFVRMGRFAARLLAPHHIVQILAAAALVLGLSGAGFWWLEPKVGSYADGLWLAFITGATVGYGDLVPSTPASRIFAVFIVILFYALFSIFTASISALFVNVDEKIFQKELHIEMQLLRDEINQLREELHHHRRAERRAHADSELRERAPP